jgi:hypothetical protein
MTAFRRAQARGRCPDNLDLIEMGEMEGDQEIVQVSRGRSIKAMLLR